MSTSLRSFVSAVLALLLLVALAEPLSSPRLDGAAPVVDVSGVHVDDISDGRAVALGHTHGTVAGGEVDSFQETLQSDRSSAPASYIKPRLAETVVAERGFDEADFVLSPSPRILRPSPARQTATESPTQETDTRRALLRVYRL